MGEILISTIIALVLAVRCDPADLPVERATEESVARWTLARPPEPYLSLISRMGSSSWKEREAASKAIVASGAESRRWLWWGRLNRDPEIAIRCNMALRQLAACSTCFGTGKHPEWRSEWGSQWNSDGPPPWRTGEHRHPRYEWGSSYACCRCFGAGNLWPRTIWDDRVRRVRDEDN